MAFSLVVHITGVCGLVKHLKEERLLVVLQNGNKTKPQSFHDGGELAKHRAFLKFDLSDWTSNQSSQDVVAGHGVWYLNGERLTVENSPGGQALDLTNLKVADMTQIVEHPHCNIDELATKPKPPPSQDPNRGPWIAGQMILDQGEFLQPHKDELQDWEFDPVLSGGQTPYRTSLPKVLRLRIGDFNDTCVISGVSFDSGKKTRLKLKPATNGKDVNVTLANAPSHDPLEWWEGPPDQSADDPDFRWHYELLTSPARNHINQQLGRKALPIPVNRNPKTSTHGASKKHSPTVPSNGNCYAVKYADAAFNM